MRYKKYRSFTRLEMLFEPLNGLIHGWLSSLSVWWIVSDVVLISKLELPLLYKQSKLSVLVDE